jgi:hypothetical protein
MAGIIAGSIVGFSPINRVTEPEPELEPDENSRLLG